MRQMYNTKKFVDIYDDVTSFTTDYATINLGGITDATLLNKLYYLLYAKFGNSPISNLDETQWKYKLFSVIFQYGPNWQKELAVQGILRDLNLSDLVDDGGLTELFTHEGENSRTESGTNGNTRGVQESGTNTGTQATAHTGTVGNTGTSTESVDHDNSISNSGQFEDIKNHALNPETTPAVNAYSPLGYINDQVANKNTSSGSQTVDESTETTGSSSATTTYNNTDTRTDNLADSRTATITDSGTTSGTTSGEDSATNNVTRNLTQGKLKGYEKLLELLNSNITEQFLTKFGPLFQKAINIRPYLYESED